MRISMPPCRATSADAAPINVSGARSIARPACRRWHMEKTLTRRTFLKVSAAGGALVVSGYLPGLRESSTAEAAGVFEPNIWIKVGSDDTVTIKLTQLEMGQGVMTSMPMLVAEELDMDWTRMKTEWVPADPRYGNPNFGGAQITAGSNSVRGMWKLLREAGGTARAMLVTAGAQTWGVPENTVSTEKGEVVHISSGIAVVADNYWAASNGAQALEVKWNEGPLANLSSADIMKKYATLAEQPGKIARNQGDAQLAMKDNTKSFERVFEVPFL